MSVFKQAAIKVYEQNQYSCHAVNDLVLSGKHGNMHLDYADMLGPCQIYYKALPLQNSIKYWWNAPPWVNRKRKPVRTKYAHQARVFALLLAHQMVLTGDIVL